MNTSYFASKHTIAKQHKENRYASLQHAGHTEKELIKLWEFPATGPEMMTSYYYYFAMLR